MGLVNRRAVTIEWGDCDPAGIVFYPRYFAMFDASTAALFAVAGAATAWAAVPTLGLLAGGELSPVRPDPVLCTTGLFAGLVAWRVERCSPELRA